MFVVLPAAVLRPAVDEPRTPQVCNPPADVTNSPNMTEQQMRRPD